MVVTPTVIESAVTQRPLAHPGAVDQRPVRRPHVDQDEALAAGPNLGMDPADVRVRELDLAVGEAAHPHHLLAQRQPAPVRTAPACLRPRPPAPWRSSESTTNVPDPTLVVDVDLDADRAGEDVVLLAGVIARGLGQLDEQHVAHAGEGCGVIGRQADLEVIRHHRAAVDADRAAVVHLPDQATAQFNGANTGAEGAGHHAFDEPLQAPFERT